MTTYEILLMLDPEGAEAHQDELIARVRELVEKSGGAWRSHDPWGRRRLAYEIAKKPEAIYHLVVFESSAETLDEISRVLKITDGVIRHLAVRRVASTGRTPVPPPPPAPAEPVSVPEPEYAEANTSSTSTDAEGEE